MVRVVSQSFSHPRSRHSSGETDLDLAMRADSALSTLRAKRTDFGDYESSSDSFWDSELDTDQQDQHSIHNGTAEDVINGNGTQKSDVHVRRKERRRERNKVSAQAYRQRRRQVTVTTQQELTLLEDRNKMLLKQVDDLEEKTEQAKQFLKGQRVSVPDFLIPKESNNCHYPSTSSSTISCDLQQATTTTTTSDDSLSSPRPHLNNNLNVNLNSQNLFFGNHPQNNHQIPISNNSNVNANGMANANLPQISSINLNTLGAPASPICDTFLSSPSVSPVAGGVPVVKPKQNIFNANHYYRVPIHHPKVLRTVQEIPSNFSNNAEEVNPLTMDNSKSYINCNSSEMKTEGAKAICDDSRTNANMELLNMNERVNSNLLHNKDDMIWNGNFHTNPLKTVNVNDNDNASLSKPRLQNSPQQLLLHPNSFVQLIITSGENKLPSQ